MPVKYASVLWHQIIWSIALLKIIHHRSPSKTSIWLQWPIFLAVSPVRHAHTHTLTPCIFKTQDTLDNLYGLNKRRRWVCVSLSECRSECDSCFNKNFCTRCRAGFFLHLGKCQENCPEGLVRSDTQRECVPSECLQLVFIGSEDKCGVCPLFNSIYRVSIQH